MIRFLSKVFLIILFSVPAQDVQASEIIWTTTEPHGLVIFLETMAGQPHRSDAMKTFFLKTPDYQSKKTIEIIHSFQSMTKDSWRNLFVSAASSPYHQFLTAALQSHTLSDLEKRTKSLFVPEIGDQFFGILNAFEPIYQKTVWRPYFSAFKKQTDAIQLDYRGHGSLLNSIAIFYGAQDYADQLFVGFYPLIQTGGNIYAENMGESQSVGVLLGHEDDSERLGTILHEFSHYMYRKQSNETKKMMNEAFLASHEKTKALANSYMDEMLATVCGNGWAVEKINGKNDDPLWYNDPTIEHFARASFNDIHPYLENKLTMDRKLIEQVFVDFSKGVAGTLHIKSVSMVDVVIFVDEERFSHNYVNATLQNLFDTRQTIVASPPQADDNQKILLNHPASTRIFVLSKDSIQKSKILFNKTPELAPFTKAIEATRGSFQIFQSNGVPIIIIYADTLSDLNAAFLGVKNYHSK